MPIVRNGDRRGRSGRVMTSRKFSRVQMWTSLPVNESKLQKAEMNRTASAAR